MSDYSRRNILSAMLALILSALTAACNPGAVAAESTMQIVLEADSADDKVHSAGDLNAAVAILQKRLTEMGMSAPTASVQDDGRIILTVGGVRDADALKALLQTRGKLEFKLVDESVDVNAASDDPVPVGSEFLPYSDGPMAGQSIAVKRTGGIGGNSIIDARQDIDVFDKTPVVNLKFDKSGTRKFAELSSNNVGGRFAIILDGKVISAPVFNEPILDGNAQISGNFTMDSATELAVMLRSGSLPVKFKVTETRIADPVE